MGEIMADVDEELYEMIEAICPKFKSIPSSEKEVMSRHMAGISSDAIASSTSRSAKSITETIDRYKALTARIPDALRVRLALKMITGSISTYAAVISDKSKIMALTPVEAIKGMIDMNKVITLVTETEIQLLEHEKKVQALDYEGFTKSLGEGA
jgi:hypothetical protein